MVKNNNLEDSLKKAEMPIIDETNYNYSLKEDDKEYQNKLNAISLHHLKLDRVAKYILYMAIIILFLMFIIYSVCYVEKLLKLVEQKDHNYALVNLGVFTSISAIFIYTFLFKIINYIFKIENQSEKISNNTLNNLYNHLKDFFINNNK